MRRLALLFAAVMLTLAVFGLGGGTAAAHPLGNFSINTASQLMVYADAVHITHVVDMAEIPTLQERPAIDRDGDGAISDVEAEAYLEATVPGLVGALSFAVGGERVRLELASRSITFPAGDAGLSTLRIELVLMAAVRGHAMADATFVDGGFEGRAGYHEVTVTAPPGVALASSTAPSISPTALLTRFERDGNTPASVRRAAFSYIPGTGERAPALSSAAARGAPVAAGAATAGPLARFIRADDLTLAALLAMLAIALGFGAVHALEPGHGKSIVAAYFIGSSGSAWQAAVLGMIVAITHSLGVFAIAAVVLVGSRFLVPETLYPWLTLASGVMVFFLGTALLAGRLRATGAWHRVLHRLHHGQTHHHGDHHHAGPGAGSAAASSRPPWATLTILGLVDGLVPTPSTLVVLLGAVSVDRLELGMLLVVAFSTGMALVMAGISVGVMAATALGRRMRRRVGAPGASRWIGRMATAVPVAAAFVLLAVGISMSLRALDQVALL